MCTYLHIRKLKKKMLPESLYKNHRFIIKRTIDIKSNEEIHINFRKMNLAQRNILYKQVDMYNLS